MKYFVERSPNGKTWEVLDSEGYSVAYVAYDTKREALDAAKIREFEDKRDHERNLVLAHQAGMKYWRDNRPFDATQAQLEFHARTCGWHDELNYAWIAGFYGAQRRDAGFSSTGVA